MVEITIFQGSIHDPSPSHHSTPEGYPIAPLLDSAGCALGKVARMSCKMHFANWKDPPFLMGKSTISMAILNSYVKLPEGNMRISGWRLTYPSEK